MIKNLRYDSVLRGYSFEYIARIMLRRDANNNFIFQTARFDDIYELCNKYRFDMSNHQKVLAYLEKYGMKIDLVEFVLDNSKTRVVEDIIFYEVKSRNNNSKRKYYETCASNHDFCLGLLELGFKVNLVSVMVFEDWNFSFNIYRYNDVFLRVYNSQTSKTLFFTNRKRLNKKKKEKLVGISST